VIGAHTHPRVDSEYIYIYIYIYIQNRLNLAHADQPVRDGHLHISAPHIYGSVLEALDLTAATNHHYFQKTQQQQPMTFLNVGSGTGYLSCLVAELLGPSGTCIGIEINQVVLDHCWSAVEAWKQSRIRMVDSNNNSNNNDETSSTTTADTTIAYMDFYAGNGLEINATLGEAAVGFDRIYIGAAVSRRDMPKLANLLRPGGVLVGPGECQF
jgi:protein-L-isoaspartate O-methyltransferase